MKKNEGIRDRTIRFGIAGVLIVLSLGSILTGTLGIIALIVAAVFLLTGFAGVCPIYSILGINSCKLKNTAGR